MATYVLEVCEGRVAEMEYFATPVTKQAPWKETQMFSDFKVWYEKAIGHKSGRSSYTASCDVGKFACYFSTIYNGSTKLTTMECSIYSKEDEHKQMKNMLYSNQPLETYSNCFSLPMRMCAKEFMECVFLSEEQLQEKLGLLMLCA